MQEQLKLDLYTGLYNRKTYDDYLPILIKECKDANICLSLAVIDLDSFKYVNDFYGHAAGDRVLLYMAQMLKNIQSDNVLAFRLGGDEFAVLFKDCIAEEAYRICEDMRKRMESTSLHDIDGHTVTFSCGLVSMIPRHTGLEAFTKAADFALYAAKNSDRNQVIIYNASIPYIKK